MTWEYIAGFTDGDGHISIVPRKGRPGYKYIRLRWAQKADQSAVLDEMQKFLASYGIQTTSITSKLQSRKYWQREFGVGGMRDIYTVLTAIRPHLILKTAKADEALSLLEEWLYMKAKHGRHWRSQLAA